MSHKQQSKPNVTIIGAGNLGLSLALALQRLGLEVSIGSRNISQCSNIMRTHAPALLNNIYTLSDSVLNADIVWICTPDSHIKTVCESLSNQFIPNTIVAHCSGSLSSEELASAKKMGCTTCSTHPLNSFPSIKAGIEVFKSDTHNTAVFCEGDALAIDALTSLWTQIGCKIHSINSEAKPLYHAAAVIACNYLTTLMNASSETAKLAGIDEGDFWQAIQPLVNTTLENMSNKGIGASLSGPIARGDWVTIEKHLDSLHKHNAPGHLLGLYQSLGASTVALAGNHGYLDSEQINDLKTSLKHS